MKLELTGSAGRSHGGTRDREGSKMTAKFFELICLNDEVAISREKKVCGRFKFVGVCFYTPRILDPNGEVQ